MLWLGRKGLTVTPVSRASLTPTPAMAIGQLLACPPGHSRLCGKRVPPSSLLAQSTPWTPPCRGAGRFPISLCRHSCPPGEGEAAPSGQWATPASLSVPAQLRARPDRGRDTSLRQRCPAVPQERARWRLRTRRPSVVSEPVPSGASTGHCWPGLTGPAWSRLLLADCGPGLSWSGSLPQRQLPGKPHVKVESPAARGQGQHPLERPTHVPGAGRAPPKTWVRFHSPSSHPHSARP